MDEKKILAAEEFGKRMLELTPEQRKEVMAMIDKLLEDQE